jgi:hypothetical protein
MIGMEHADGLVSDAVREMALELVREERIRPLGSDEQRPDGYYSVGHYTNLRMI